MRRDILHIKMDNMQVLRKMLCFEALTVAKLKPKPKCDAELVRKNFTCLSQISPSLQFLTLRI